VDEVDSGGVGAVATDDVGGCTAEPCEWKCCLDEDEEEKSSSMYRWWALPHSSCWYGSR
jgi:hypothetical protein